MRTTILTATLLLSALGATAALAQATPCCKPKPCVQWDSEGHCLTPNAGKACRPNDLGNVTAAPEREAVAGCIESGDNCIGGATTSSGPDGCTGLLGYYGTTEKTTGATDFECTNAAVDACCKHDACD